MNLKDIERLRKVDDKRFASSELGQACIRSLSRKISMDTTEAYWKMRLRIAAGFLWLAVVAATFLAAMLHMFHIVTLDDVMFDRLWTTFKATTWAAALTTHLFEPVTITAKKLWGKNVAESDQ